MLPGMELISCPNLAVPREVMHHVVRVESSYNPYAIGVVGGRLVRQPRNLPEALSTARMLEQRGYNFSLGLAQVNRYNLVKYGLDSYEKAFQPCANLQAGSRILAECYQRSRDWGKSFSCYYSGDFKTGYRHGYVQKVYASMQRERRMDATFAGVAPIAVVDRVVRRTGRPVEQQTAAGATTGSLVERRGADYRSAPTTRGQPAVIPQGQGAAPTSTPASMQATQAQVPIPATAAFPMASAGSGAVVVMARRANDGAAPDAPVAPQPTAVSPSGGDSAFVF